MNVRKRSKNHGRKKKVNHEKSAEAIVPINDQYGEGLNLRK